MLDAARPLSERWNVHQGPVRHEVGARFEALDVTGLRRDALITAALADVPPSAVRAAAADLAALPPVALRALAPPSEILRTPEGYVIEVLPLYGLRPAAEYVAMVSANCAPGQVVGQCAGYLADVADELAALHDGGGLHGGIAARWLFSYSADGGRLVLAGFSYPRLRRRVDAAVPEPTPGDDARALVRAFLALLAGSKSARLSPEQRSPLDALLAPDAPAVTARTVADALRLLAGRSTGGPYRQAAGRTPLFPAAAYREAPPKLPMGFAGHVDDTNVWRSPRMLGLVTLGVVGGLSSMLRMMGFFGGPDAQARSQFNDAAAMAYLASPGDPTLAAICAGEPTQPVAYVTVPGRGDVQSVAAACEEGELRVAVHRGRRVYGLTRSTSHGAAWEPRQAEVPEGDNANDPDGITALSEAAPAATDGAFVVVQTPRAPLGIARLASPADVESYAWDHVATAHGMYPLGATRTAMYVASTRTDDGVDHAVVLRLRRAAGEPRLTEFPLGDGMVRSVQPSTTRAGVLLVGPLGPAGHTVQTVAVDLAALDGATVGAPPGAIIAATAIRVHDPVIAAPALGTVDNPAFLLGLGDVETQPDGACHGVSLDGLCVRWRGTTAVFVPTRDNPSVPAPFAPDAAPVAAWSAGVLLETLVQDAAHRLERVSLDAAHRVVRRGTFAAPRSLPAVDTFNPVTCDGVAWMVFEGTRGRTPTISALPAACTSIEPAPPRR